MELAIKKRCSVICEPGSVVEVSAEQARALISAGVAVEAKKPAPKKAAKKKEE